MPIIDGDLPEPRDFLFLKQRASPFDGCKTVVLA
jgi:hypothetical protein